MKQILFFFAALIFSQSLFSQSQIVGKIRDERHEPFAFCTVVLQKVDDASLQKTAQTTLDGDYEFSEIENGSYFVIANSSEMGQLKTAVFEANGQPIELNDLDFGTVNRRTRKVNRAE